MRLKRTREEILAYHRQYNKKYKPKKSSKPILIDRQLKGLYLFDEYNKAEPVNEKLLAVSEITCDEFGCGKVLNRIEKLCGKKCINHSVKKRKYGY